MNFQLRIKYQRIFGQFFISSWSEKGHEPSRAELKNLQLELWLEPARLGLITVVASSYEKSMVFERRPNPIHYAAASLFERPQNHQPGLTQQLIYMEKAQEKRACYLAGWPASCLST